MISGKLLNPLWRRLHLLIGRAILTAVDDSMGLQRVQARAGATEVLDGDGKGLEVMGRYGFTSNAPDGAQALVLFPSGDRSHGLVVSIEDGRVRLKGLAKGEAAMYGLEGAYVWIKNGRELHADADKYQFQGENNELMDRIIALGEVVEEGFLELGNVGLTTTNTGIGPQPLNNAASMNDKGAMAGAIKADIEEMKV